uniref:Uncharacterized protein n=1 Tax=Arundo donax TaxID=35708 RepID=A0A0A9D7Z5_ARUDO
MDLRRMWMDLSSCFIFFRDSSAFDIFSEIVFSSSDRVVFSFFLCSSYCTSNFSLSSSNFEKRSLKFCMCAALSLQNLSCVA